MGATRDRMAYNRHWTEGQQAACDAVERPAFVLADTLDAMPKAGR